MRLFVIVAILFSYVACQSMPSEEQHASRIRTLDDRWLEAAAQHDLDGMMSIYAPNAQELLPDMPPLTGRDAIRSFYARLMEDYPRFAHHFEAEEITIAHSSDLAVVRGSYKFTPDTLKPQESQTGKFIGVWQNENGDWRLRYNISNAD